MAGVGAGVDDADGDAGAGGDLPRLLGMPICRSPHWYGVKSLVRAVPAESRLSGSSSATRHKRKRRIAHGAMRAGRCRSSPRVGSGANPAYSANNRRNPCPFATPRRSGKARCRTARARCASASGAFEGPYSFSSRFEEGTGTNPEELLAAAHAGCFSMALAGALGRAEHAADPRVDDGRRPPQQDRRRLPHPAHRPPHRGRGPRHRRRQVPGDRRARPSRAARSRCCSSAAEINLDAKLVARLPSSDREHGVDTRSISCALDPLVGGVGQRRVAGPEVGRRDAPRRRRTPRRSSPAWPAAARRRAADERGQQRVVERRRRRRRDVDAPRRRRRPRAPSASTSRTWASASSRVRSGAKRWLSVDRGPVGHDVAGHAALDRHRLQRLAELAAVEHRPPLLVGGDRGQHRAEAVDGVAAHPRPGGVGPLARPASPRRASCPGSRPRSRAPVGSPRTAASPASRSGRSPNELARGRCTAAVDLLALVEDVGDVDRRARRRCGPARAARPARPSCRPRRGPTARRPRAGRCSLPLARHGVGVAGEDQPLRPRPSVGAGHQRCRRRGRPSSHGTARSSASRWSVIAASSWLTDGMSTSSAVSARAGRSRLTSRRRARAGCR